LKVAHLAVFQHDEITGEPQLSAKEKEKEEKKRNHVNVLFVFGPLFQFLQRGTQFCSQSSVFYIAKCAFRFFVRGVLFCCLEVDEQIFSFFFFFSQTEQSAPSVA
jgi:hypothetical protein